MIIDFSPKFHEKIKKLDVRIQKSFKISLKIFIKNPDEPSLDNHELKKEWTGYRSIDVTADYRAIFEQSLEHTDEGVKISAYFVIIGTHKELFRSKFLVKKVRSAKK